MYRNLSLDSTSIEQSIHQSISLEETPLNPHPSIAFRAVNPRVLFVSFALFHVPQNQV